MSLALLVASVNALPLGTIPVSRMRHAWAAWRTAMYWAVWMISATRASRDLVRHVAAVRNGGAFHRDCEPAVIHYQCHLRTRIPSQRDVAAAVAACSSANPGSIATACVPARLTASRLLPAASLLRA